MPWTPPPGGVDDEQMKMSGAGVAYGSSVEGSEYPDAEWVVGINFWGVVYGTKAFLPHLRASGEGHVINTSSLFGLLSMPGVRDDLRWSRAVAGR